MELGSNERMRHAMDTMFPRSQKEQSHMVLPNLLNHTQSTNSRIRQKCLVRSSRPRRGHDAELIWLHNSPTALFVWGSLVSREQGLIAVAW